MLMSEFIERTNFYPSFDEYRGLEEMYYHYQGDKDDFCAHFVKNKDAMLNKAHEIACQMFAQERDRLLSQLHKAECKLQEAHNWRDAEERESQRQYAKLLGEYEDYKSLVKKVVDSKQVTIDRQCAQIMDLERENADIKAQLDALKKTIKLVTE